MKFQRDERRLDFTKIGLAIKRAREAKGMTQEDLAFVIDRTLNLSRKVQSENPQNVLRGQAA